MKNIVLIIDSLIGGGAETTNCRLADLFIEKNYQVHIIILKDIIELEMNSKLKVYCLNYRKRKKLFNNNYYAKELSNTLTKIKNKSLIIGSLGLTHKLMNKIDKKFDFYYALHGMTTKTKLTNKKGFSKLKKRIELFNLYNKKNLLCVSNGVKDDILTLNIIPKSIETIYNPFDFNEIKTKANEKINYKLPKRYIVHVGRFSKIKRHDILIRAFSIINDKSIKLLLIGEGEEKTNIEKLIYHLNLENEIELVGFKKNPYPFIKNAEVLVLSSESEGFGNVLIESMILNTKIVSTNAPSGPKEILKDTLRKYLSIVNDFNDLSTKINLAIEDKINIEDKYISNYKKENVLKSYIKLLK